jgi:hypothetical protein
MHSDVAAVLEETTRQKLDRLADERYGRSFGELPEFDRDRLVMMLEVAQKAERVPEVPPRMVEKSDDALRAIADERVAAAFKESGWGGKLLSALMTEIAKCIKTKHTELADRCAKLDERLRALETDGTLQSHEHRLERHASHLAALETRLKKLERQ